MKIFVFVLIMLFSFIFVGAVTAQTPINPLQRTVRSQAETTTLDKTTNNLQTRALAEIDRRVMLLQMLIEKIPSFKFISDAEKALFSEKIQAEITRLSSLKVNISSQTDTQMLRSDIKTILDSHNTFAFLLPTIRIIAAANALTTAGNELFNYAAKLEKRIEEAQAAGNETSRLTTQLAAMRFQITSAQTLATTIIANAMSLDLEAYPANRTTMQTALKNITTATQHLRTALKTGNTIRMELSKMNTSAPLGTPSATTSPLN